MPSGKASSTMGIFRLNFELAAGGMEKFRGQKELHR